MPVPRVTETRALSLPHAHVSHHGENNTVFNRLIRALPPGITYTSATSVRSRLQALRGFVQTSTVWRDDSLVVIADMRCTSEADTSALELSFQEKMDKYTNLALSVAATGGWVR